jgi:hypothetical protein
MTAALVDNNGHPASDALPPRRVPAWKKLGLRLKLTEQTDQPTQLDKNTSTNRKRRRDEDSQNLPEAAGTKHNLRKRMRLDQPNTPPTKSNATNVKVLSPSLRRDSNGIRKTVSFTSDTKVEDGDSSKSLIAGWAAQYDQPSFSANLPKVLERAKVKPSKAKVTKSKKPKSRPTTKKPHAALEYLTQFRDSRDTWKFRKNREVWILKHLFSIDDIPSEYDISLSQYLQGLKSPSACSRIRQEAEEVIRKDCEQHLEYTVSGSKDGESKVEEVLADMEDPERRRAYYEDSIRRYKRKLQQHLDEVAEEELNWVSPERLAKRRRAEILLWAIGVTPSNADATQRSDTISQQETPRNGSRPVEKGAYVKIAQKKRKNRTSVVELSSSSEDESSDSDSEPDTDEGQGGDVAEESDSDSSSIETITGTQSSGWRCTQQGADPDEGTESSSSSDETSDDSHSDMENAAITNVRAKSIISISS